MDATKFLDRLDQQQLRDRLRAIEEERAALIALIRAAIALKRTRSCQSAPRRKKGGHG